MMIYYPTAIALVSFSLFSGGCSSTSPEVERGDFEVKGRESAAKFDPATGRLKTIDVDINKNGRTDAFSKWDGTRLLRIEMDRDEDGQIDRWEHYDENNKMTRIGSSSRDDGVEDTWTYPDEDGFLGRVESDTDRDGTVDKREMFVPAGTRNTRVLAVVELDIDQSGRPSRRLYYRVDGSFDRTEVVR